MSNLNLQSPSAVFVTALTIGYLLWKGITHIAVQRRRTAFKLEHGCKDSPANIRKWDVFGLYGLYEIMKAAQEYKLLEYFDDNFKAYGSTYIDIRFGSQCIDTIDAENFKTVHATNFEDW